jgi:hypothetical protein
MRIQPVFQQSHVFGVVQAVNDLRIHVSAKGCTHLTPPEKLSAVFGEQAFPQIEIEVEVQQKAVVVLV